MKYTILNTSTGCGNRKIDTIILYNIRAKPKGVFPSEVAYLLGYEV